MLVVEDDEDLATGLVSLLGAGGLDARFVTSGEDAMAHVGSADADLVLLDRILPDTDGIEVCAALRASGYEGGVILMSGRRQELDIVSGLDAGADDYLVKPCSIAELQSRVRSVLRRIHRAEPATASEGGFVVGEHQITYDGVAVATRGREYDVLAMLVAEPDVVVTHEELLDRVWGSEWAGSSMVLPAAIGRIRDRLAALDAPVTVDNVRGVGFRLSSR